VSSVQCPCKDKFPRPGRLLAAYTHGPMDPWRDTGPVCVLSMDTCPWMHTCMYGTLDLSYTSRCGLQVSDV